MAYQSVLVTFDKSPVKVDVSLPLVGPQGAQGPKGDKGDTGEFSGTLDDNLEITDPTKGLILRSDNGTRYLFTVENNGQLKRVALAIIASVIMFWPSKLFAQYDVLVDSNGLITAPTNFLNANGIPTLGGNNTFSGTNTFSTLRTTQTNVMLGEGASASGGGGAIGNGTVVYGGGGAIGQNAYVDDGGGAIGQNAYAVVGGAIGYNAYAVVGGAIGYNAKSTGYGVQLSTGTNSTDNTLQFLNWQVVDTNGNVPVGRFGNLFTNTNNFTADNTFGDAAGDSMTVNAGTFTAPNATNTASNNVANVGALDGRYFLIAAITGSRMAQFPTGMFLPTTTGGAWIRDNINLDTVTNATGKVLSLDVTMPSGTNSVAVLTAPGMRSGVFKGSGHPDWTSKITVSFSFRSYDKATQEIRAQYGRAYNATTHEALSTRGVGLYITNGSVFAEAHNGTNGYLSSSAVASLDNSRETTFTYVVQSGTAKLYKNGGLVSAFTNCVPTNNEVANNDGITISVKNVSAGTTYFYLPMYPSVLMSE